MLSGCLVACSYCYPIRPAVAGKAALTHGLTPFNSIAISPKLALNFLHRETQADSQ